MFKIIIKSQMLIVCGLLLQACSIFDFNDDDNKISKNTNNTIVEKPFENNSENKKNAVSMAQIQLLDIIKEQKDLLKEASIGKKTKSDLTTRYKRLLSSWQAYISSYPDDLDAKILYGKFLRAIDDCTLAYNIFYEIDQKNPNIAVVKQQLATYEGDCGIYDKAYANIKKAIQLDDKQAIYYYQAGELLSIFYDEFLSKKILSVEEINREMSFYFKKACLLDEANLPYKWSYAQCFYDMQNANWDEALQAWNMLIPNLNMNLEIQTALVNKARVLLELYQDDEAEKILEKIDAPSLMRNKNHLLDILRKNKLNSALNDKKDEKNKAVLIPIIPQKTYTQ